MKAVIIGYGNPLRGDDGIGWYIAARLADLSDREHVQIIACHQLTPELSATIAPVDLVVFVDADCSSTPGEIRRRGVLAEPGGKIMTHAMSPELLLACARDLYQGSPRAELFTIGGRCFDHTEGLTPIVRRACDQAVQQICALLGCLQANEQAHHA